MIPPDEIVHLSLTMMSGPQDGFTLTFDMKERSHITVTIGRREGCDIILSYDSQVSRIHARIIYDAREVEYFIEDADSRNGTWIGQERIEGRHTIRPGTLFRVGRTWLRLDAPPTLLGSGTYFFGKSPRT
jgi:pSer/pThr/pTyr-binding forkhead associated (FHA) protein